jgi:hypothetical protein
LLREKKVYPQISQLDEDYRRSGFCLGKTCFLKKTRKRPLLIWTVLVEPTLAQINKSFLLLFFKKEVLACFSRPASRGCQRALA